MPVGLVQFAFWSASLAADEFSWREPWGRKFLQSGALLLVFLSLCSGVKNKNKKLSGAECARPRFSGGIVGGTKWKEALIAIHHYILFASVPHTGDRELSAEKRKSARIFYCWAPLHADALTCLPVGRSQLVSRTFFIIRRWGGLNLWSTTNWIYCFDARAVIGES